MLAIFLSRPWAAPTRDTLINAHDPDATASVSMFQNILTHDVPRDGHSRIAAVVEEFAVLPLLPNLAIIQPENGFTGPASERGYDLGHDFSFSFFLVLDLLFFGHLRLSFVHFRPDDSAFAIPFNPLTEVFPLGIGKFVQARLCIVFRGHQRLDIGGIVIVCCKDRRGNQNHQQKCQRFQIVHLP